MKVKHLCLSCIYTKAEHSLEATAGPVLADCCTVLYVFWIAVLWKGIHNLSLTYSSILADMFILTV